MSRDALDAAVDPLIRQVAAEIVMPRFANLAEGDIEEKSPGDLVTVADKLSEARLAEGLARILPDARMIGEEGVAADASLLEGIGAGLAWIVDPIDGTGNYAAGRPPFAIMVGLVADGEMQAGWILDPTTDRMLHARAGAGAWRNGERIYSAATGSALPRTAMASRYLPDGLAADWEARAAGRLQLVPIPFCAGEQYARLSLREDDMSMFWRALPWDHAPGALILREAGGRVAWTDGAEWRLSDERKGLIAAATPALWDLAAEALCG